MMPQIWVRTNTRDKIRTIKTIGNFSSYDEVIDISIDILRLIIEVKSGIKPIGELYNFINDIIEEKRKVRGI